MTRKSILKLIAWMRKGGVVVDEKTFFQTAYFIVFGKAEPRCMLCFAFYLKTGHVPVFVRQFIQQYLVIGDSK